MSLLDDVSIVVTPNGYKAGELYAVIPVPTEGAELVTNGDFATDSDWSKARGVTISGGNAIFNNSTANNNGIYQAAVFQTNTQYKITAEVSNYSSGNVTAWSGSSQNSTSNESFTGNGTKTWIISTGASNGYFLLSSATTNGNFNIDNISVKEYTSADMDVTRATAATRVDENGLVNYAEIIGSEEVTNGDFATDSDWTKGAGWTISGGTASHTGGASYLSQDVLQVDTLYKVNISVTAVSGGGFVQIYMGNNPASVLISVIGDYTYYFTSQSSVTLGFALRSLGDVTIDNVSVKEAARDNVPRIDYTGGGCPHILAEPQRTNELLQSNQFDTTWNQSGTLTSGQDGVGGSTDAWKFENPNATSSLYQTDTTSGVQTVSAYFKKNSNYGVRFFAFGSVNCSTYFDLNNGAVVSVINSTAKVEPAGADWFRCSMTFDQTTSRCDFYVTNNASTQVLGDYTIQYAQLEAGSYATSYIPTSGSTVTRNQDIFTRDGIGSLINSTEGVFFAEFKPKLSSDFSVLTLNNNSSQEIVFIGKYNNTNTMFVGLRHLFSYSILYTSSSQDLTIFNKVAVKWKSGDMAVWVNGVEVLTSTSTDVPIGMTELSFDFSLNQFPFYGEVKQLQVYKTALTDEQLLQLTGESGTDFYESYAEMAAALTYTLQ